MASSKRLCICMLEALCLILYNVCIHAFIFPSCCSCRHIVHCRCSRSLRALVVFIKQMDEWSSKAWLHQALHVCWMNEADKSQLRGQVAVMHTTDDCPCSAEGSWVNCLPRMRDGDEHLCAAHGYHAHVTWQTEYLFSCMNSIKQSSRTVKFLSSGYKNAYIMHCVARHLSPVLFRAKCLTVVIWIMWAGSGITWIWYSVVR